ncbi:OsmC family protein [Armatimonas rosea]|uniref:Putative redox protein n=1 Tax=Armatimonas rosea TaxID=685828 RepID=A0A7W9W7E6_ARMRO|nr:OsmC family protein [Armatimonas rosea]MBB6050552.1 putative redox protein [Armatimonas rosea]
MIEIAARYEGKTKCQLTHPEGMVLQTDTPKELGGDAAAFSPTDLVASGLVTCILTTIALWGERRQLDLVGMSATVVKEMSTTANRIGRLAVTVTVPAALVPEGLRPRLEAIGHRCPVHASLHPEIEAPIIYQYV